MDDKVIDVLKRLSECAIEHAFQSYSKVIEEKATSSVVQITSQRHQTWKDFSRLLSTSSNIISSTCLSNVSSSVKDVNCGSTTFYGRERGGIHEKSSMNRLNSFKGMITSHDNGYNHNDITVEHKNASSLKEEPKEFENCRKPMHKRIRKIQHIHSVMRLPQDAISSHAMCFSAQSGCNGVDKNRLDKNFGLSDLEKVIEASAPLDFQDFTRTGMDSIKEKNCVGTHCRSTMKDVCSQYSGPTEKLIVLNQTNDRSILDGNVLLPNRNHEGPQMPSSKEVQMPGQMLSQNSKSIQRQSNLLSGTAILNDGKRKIASMADEKVSQSRNSRNESQRLRTETTREGSAPTRMLSQTTARLGPTLLRTASMGPHAKKDEVDKHQPLDSNRKGSRTQNKTSTQKSRPHQIISLQTLVEEKPRGNNVRPPHMRSGTQKNTHLGPPNKHPLSEQKTKGRKVSISTSASSYSSWASRRGGIPRESEEDEDLVPSKTMTHQPFMNNPTSHVASEKSMKSSRRTSHYSMVGPSHRAGSTAAHRKKQMGPLRRFKNKLGVIFHHHHHHHHHHHQAGAEGEVGNTKLSNHRHSFWKYLGKMLHRTNRDDDDVQGKNSRGVAAGYHGRGVAAGYHGLIDGLLRHVWHSKKSKRSGDIKRLGKSHSQKNSVKKWHWWQKIYKRSGGVVRQTSIRRPRVRLGFKAKKRSSQLRALKMN